MKNQNNKKLFVIAALVLFGLFSLSLFAQEKKDELDARLKEIKGTVEKIIIKVDGKEIIFEGKDAEKIGESIKVSGKIHRMRWLSHIDEDFDLAHGNAMMYKFHGDDFDWKHKEGGDKKIEIKIEDGKKKVTVTTTKDGEEETKTYEGEEAEKFIKEHEKNGDVFILHSDEGNFEWSGKDGEQKKVEVKIEDGKKKVTVTTMKDGKEETKTYEGEEADKFLSENEHGKSAKIISHGEEGGDFMFFNKRINHNCCCCCGKMDHSMKMPKHVKEIIIEKKEKKTEKEEVK